MDNSSNDTPERKTATLDEQQPVRVFVVEDERSARQRLCESISTDRRLHLSGHSDCYSLARRWLADGRHQVDVLLVDLGLPDGSGVDLIGECTQLRPEVAIMVMTLFGDERHVFSSLERGASGYLLKSTPAGSIAEHILDLHAGGSPITPTVARLLIKRMATKPPSSAPDHLPEQTRPPLTEALSARELDVLNQIAVGYNTAEIALRLNISTHTVTAHVRHVYRKLQVRSRSAAIFEGTRRGLIEHNQP